MSIKTLIERIDSIEKTQKTTLAESVEQGLAESQKPDYLDFDKDGNKKEPMKKALQDKKKMKKVKEGQTKKTGTGLRHHGTYGTDHDVGQEDGQADEKKTSAKKPQHTYDAPFGTTKIPPWKGPKTVHKISDVEPGKKSDGEVRRRGRPKKVTEMTDREFHGFMRGIMVLEEKMSSPQKAEKERIVKGMKKSAVPGLKKRYGERWQDVMHATATKMAMENQLFKAGLRTAVDSGSKAFSQMTDILTRSPVRSSTGGTISQAGSSTIHSAGKPAIDTLPNRPKTRTSGGGRRRPTKNDDAATSNANASATAQGGSANNTNVNNINVTTGGGSSGRGGGERVPTQVTNPRPTDPKPTSPGPGPNPTNPTPISPGPGPKPTNPKPISPGPGPKPTNPRPTDPKPTKPGPVPIAPVPPKPNPTKPGPAPDPARSNRRFFPVPIPFPVDFDPDRNPDPSATTSPNPTPAPSPTNVGQMYKIGQGDTLSQIAAKQGVSVASLMAANPEITNPDRIRAGQEIRMVNTPQTREVPYAGGVGTVANTQANIAAGRRLSDVVGGAAQFGRTGTNASFYKDDVISQQAAERSAARAAAGGPNQPNEPGSGPAQMLGNMISKDPPEMPPAADEKILSAAGAPNPGEEIKESRDLSDILKLSGLHNYLDSKKKIIEESQNMALGEVTSANPRAALFTGIVDAYRRGRAGTPVSWGTTRTGNPATIGQGSREFQRQLAKTSGTQRAAYGTGKIVKDNPRTAAALGATAAVAGVGGVGYGINSALSSGSDPAAAASAAGSSGQAAGGSYQIRPGDTLSQIAQRQGTSVRELMRLNPQLSDPNKIRAGATLNLAGAGKESTYAGGVGSAPMPRTGTATTPGQAPAAPVVPDRASAARTGTGAAGMTGTGAVVSPTTTPTPSTTVSTPTPSTQSDGTTGEEAGRLAATMPPSAPIKDADAEREAELQRRQAQSGTNPVMTGAGGVLQSGSGAPVNSPAPGTDTSYPTPEGKYSNNIDRMLTELKDIVRLAGFKK
jgi:LysM repeat protein